MPWDFLLESSPFQDPGDPGDSHGYPNSLRGNNRGPIYKEFPMKVGVTIPNIGSLDPDTYYYFFSEFDLRF